MDIKKFNRYLGEEAIDDDWLKVFRFGLIRRGFHVLTSGNILYVKRKGGGKPIVLKTKEQAKLFLAAQGG